MDAKLFLLKDNKYVEIGSANIPAITLLTERRVMEAFEKNFSLTCTLTKRSRSRLFGKKRKYTYRTIKKK